jgi:pimeloyl-ACP methyl ester carboxylesterase
MYFDIYQNTFYNAESQSVCMSCRDVKNDSHSVAVTRTKKKVVGVVLGVILLSGAVLWITWLIIRPPLIDVGGYRLEARVKGTGNPAVVFETGFTGGVLFYWKLQNRVAAHTRTLVYERAGLGRSDPGPQPRTAEQMARDLHALLAALDIRPPVVLVGHSAGGLFMRVFAHDYPADVAAMVFIDPATEASYERMRQSSPGDWQSMEAKLSAGLRQQWNALPESFNEARSAWPLPSIPYVMITATKPLGEWALKSPKDMEAWSKEHQALLSELSSTTTTHIILAQADHLSVLNEPSVAKAILDTVEQVRTQRLWPASGGAGIRIIATTPNIPVNTR